MNDFEEDEDLPPMPKGKKLPPKPAKPGKKPAFDDDEEPEEGMNDFEEDEDLPPMPKGKKPGKKPALDLSGSEDEAPAKPSRRTRRR